jgi:hypothetical protein
VGSEGLASTVTDWPLVMTMGPDVLKEKVVDMGVSVAVVSMFVLVHCARNAERRRVAVSDSCVS